MNTVRAGCPYSGLLVHVSIVALLVVASASVRVATGSEVRCANLPVVAVGWPDHEAPLVCSAVKDSLEWLGAHSLVLAETVTVRPLADPPNTPSASHPIGRYDATNREIAVLSFAGAVDASHDSRPAFGIEMDRNLWKSYIAHEAAHAVVDRYLPSGVPHLSAGEYIAGVVQLATMPDETRTKVLDSHRHVNAWASAAEISEVYYFIAPDAFAVKCYRHYMALTPTERNRFISRLTTEGLRD